MHLFEYVCVCVLGNLAAVLLGFAIFVSLSNIAFDVYLKIKGCCGLFPDACTYKDLFRNTESYIQKTQKETDAIWVKGNIEPNIFCFLY